MNSHFKERKVKKSRQMFSPPHSHVCCLPLEHSLDLTSVTTDLQKVNAHKELWELKAAYRTWKEEWEQTLFTEVSNHSLCTL